MAGLDPAIHLLRKKPFSRSRWTRGTSPRVTTEKRRVRDPIMKWIIIGVIVAIALYAVAVYNRLVRQRNMVREGWSGIDVQLKRRTDLVPNLVETVKAYAAHERGV